MKRTLCKLLTFVVIIATLLTVLSSCGIFKSVFKKAEFIMNIASHMSNVEGYNAEYMIESQLNISGISIEYTVEGTEAIFPGESDNYRDYSYSSAKIVIDGKTQKNAYKRGYQDGHMFLYVIGKSDYAAIKTKIDKEAYIEFKEKYMVGSAEINVLKNCQTFEVEDIDGGLKKATFSNISSNGLDEYSELVTDISSILSEKYFLEDVEVILIVDEDYYLLEQSIDFIYECKDDTESKENIPKIKYTCKYSNRGNPVAEDVNLDKYKQDDDLRAIYYLDHALDEVIENDNVTFDFAATTKIGDSSVVEEYNGTFENNEVLTFSYDYLIKSSENKEWIAGKQVYDGNELRTESKGSSSSQRISEQVAKQTIKGIVDIASFYYGRVNNFETKTDSDGKTVIEIGVMDPSADRLINSVPGYEVTVNEINEKITITIDADGKIESYQYKYCGSFYVRSVCYTYSFDSKCDLKY